MRFMLLDHPSLMLEVHPVEASGHLTTSSMPSVRITRICATPCETVETSSIPSGMADRSNLYHLPHRRGVASLGDLNNRNGEEMEHSRASTGRSTLSSEDTGRRRTKGNRSSTTGRYWWQPPVPPPPLDGQNARSPLPG
jgi:hypothetical protein